MYAKNSELSYVVKNLATGEKSTYDGYEVRKWCTTQSLDNMVDYCITFTVVCDNVSLLGKGVITHELYFTCVKRSDVPAEVVHPLWLLEVSNAENNEVVARNWFGTPGAMLTWADEQILNWRYTEAGVVNHRFYAMLIWESMRLACFVRWQFIMRIQKHKRTFLNCILPKNKPTVYASRR